MDQHVQSGSMRHHFPGRSTNAWYGRCASYLEEGWESVVTAACPQGCKVQFGYGSKNGTYMNISGWRFGTFFIFPYIGNNNPNLLIFFKGVETTNQISFFDVLVIVDVHLFGKDGPTCVDSSQCWKASIWWEQDDFPHILMRGTDNLNVFSKYPVPWCGHLAGWWFQTFFIVHNIWGWNHQPASFCMFLKTTVDGGAP